MADEELAAAAPAVHLTVDGHMDKRTLEALATMIATADRSPADEEIAKLKAERDRLNSFMQQLAELFPGLESRHPAHPPELFYIREIDRVIQERDAALAMSPKWIPCSERLPLMDGDYMVYRPDCCVPVFVATFFVDGKEWMGDDGGAFFPVDGVTHWQPMPMRPGE